MPNDNRGIRFPRGKYARRVQALMDELGDWRDRYQAQAFSAESPFLRETFLERAHFCDEIWHDLQGPLFSLAYWGKFGAPPRGDAKRQDVIRSLG